MAVNNSLNKYVISPNNLSKKNNANSKIIDCRWYLKDKKRGQREFIKSHIRDAIFFDINKLSSNLELPHMLPSGEDFIKFLNKNGLNYTNEIIIYDQVGFFCSSRVWFTFKYFGFKNIKILNGGFKEWKVQNFPVTKSITKNKRSNIYLKKKIKNCLINQNQIRTLMRLEKQAFKIIDARPRDRFLGIKEEPRKNLRKGNISSSINIPFTEIVKKNGRIKNTNELRLLFNEKIIKKQETIICYCGSGVTACNLIFALNIIGLFNTKLYDGSWAEWGRK